MIDLGRTEVKVSLSRSRRLRGLAVILLLGLIICFWQLGSTGLVDETPPKFAAAGRTMSSTGDWLTPMANGIPRFDKPPMTYWLMGLIYLLPGQEIWDPLGSWSARFPSAFASVILMIFLGDTVMRWPQKNITFPRLSGVITALAFGLSPLVLIWSRIAVSDALLCSTLGVSLLLQWRSYVNPSRFSWVFAWIVLALAVLTKGPVAIVLMIMILTLFAFVQRDLVILCKRIRPIFGFLLTIILSLPWYLIELIREGRPFWDSFFGYHNFQRFTTVVNSHQEPWWFFLMVFVIASLPFTPLLILSLSKFFVSVIQSIPSAKNERSESLLVFASCWLICVFILFTCAGTKLPSYWLPAIPAAAILIGISESAFLIRNQRKFFLWAWGISILLIAAISLVMWSSVFWTQLGLVDYIKDPEIPNFGNELISSGIILRGAFCFTISALFGLILFFRFKPGGLLSLQLPIVMFQLLVIIPMFNLVDKLRQLPLRNASELMLSSQFEGESFAMVGVSKPSVHFYTGKVVLYEGNTSRNLVNLSERLSLEVRQGWKGKPVNRLSSSQTVLLIIDEQTSHLSHWDGLRPDVLGKFGIYFVWRIDRNLLNERASDLINSEGIRPNWQMPKPERF